MKPSLTIAALVLMSFVSSSVEASASSRTETHDWASTSETGDRVANVDTREPALVGRNARRTTNPPRAIPLFEGEHPIARYGAAGVPEYYLEDGIRSVVGVVDDAGGVVETYAYDSFGVARGGGAEPDGFGFQGMWRDADGTYFVRARVYDARTGRFLSRDPFEGITQRPDTLAPYGFAGQNPQSFSDSTGLYTMSNLMATSIASSALAGVASFAANVDRLGCDLSVGQLAGLVIRDAAIGFVTPYVALPLLAHGGIYALTGAGLAAMLGVLRVAFGAWITGGEATMEDAIISALANVAAVLGARVIDRWASSFDPGWSGGGALEQMARVLVTSTLGAIASAVGNRRRGSVAVGPVGCRE